MNYNIKHFDLILHEKTKEEFGYNIDELTIGSNKFIYHRCFICNGLKKTRFISFVNNMGITHKGECSKKLGEIRNLEKYGVKNPSELNFIKERIKENNIKKFGVDNPMKLDEFKDKLRQNVIDKYGINNISKLDKIKNKKIETSLKNYGVLHPLKSPKICDKKNKTNIEKYGGNAPQCSNEIKEKTILTNIKKRGVRNVMQDKIVSIKAGKNRIAKGTTRKIFNKEYWLLQSFGDCHIANDQELPEVWSESSCIYVDVICSCNKRWKVIFKDLVSGNTKSCGHNHKSREQQEVYNFIEKELDIRCVEEYKIDGKKFDIFIPNLNICIEYHGLVWHCEMFNNKPMCDYEKYLICKNNNIRYISIYQDEWIYEKDRVKNYLRYVLGSGVKYKVRPQKLNIVYEKTFTKEARDFIKQYHYLSEKTQIQHVWQCYYGGILIGVMCIGKPTRQNINEPYELKRVCLHPDYKCYGLWSYLLKNFVNKILSGTLTSFSDNRRDTGNLYGKLGFIKIKELKPDYWWTDRTHRFHKSGFRKTSEERLTGKTEKELREEQGYYRIWDCGKTKCNIVLG